MKNKKFSLTIVPSEKYKSKLQGDLIIFQPEYQLTTYAGKDVDKKESYTPLVGT